MAKYDMEMLGPPSCFLRDAAIFVIPNTDSTLLALDAVRSVGSKAC
jgi:hypothetical protein